MTRKHILLLAAGLLLLTAAGLFNDRQSGHYPDGAGNGAGDGAGDRTSQIQAHSAGDRPDGAPYNSGNQPTIERLSYTGFLERVEAGEIASVRISPDWVRASADDNHVQIARVPANTDAVSHFRAAGADITAVPGEREGGGFASLLGSWGPTLLIIGVLVYLFRRQANAQGGTSAAKAGKSQAKLLTEDSRKALFNDVAGCDEAKAEIAEIVDFLKDPERYTAVGGQIPKGVLMSGPSGTGKTLLARAVAGEAGVPFFTTSGSAFTEMYVGVGASRVRNMFAEAKKKAPCIVFIDEVDTIGRRRNASVSGGNEEREQTLNQLLAEMDGFESNDGVILIAATNMPEALDPALVRPGRFDRQVTVPNPDVRGREDILRVHAARVPLAGDVSLRRIARSTPGFSGAELANIVNEAALFAARAGARAVTSRHFELAGDKVRMGAERRGLTMSEKDRKLIAYHEAGHAIVGLFVPGNDPLHKVTIIPRGSAMGFAMWIPENDRWGYSILELTGRIAMAYGGRVAEELVFGREHVTSGAQGDIRQASAMARQMVLEWGMSEQVGLVDFGQDPQTGQMPQISPQVRAEIDAEIKRLLDEGQTAARQALEQNQEAFHLLAQALLEYETLDAAEIERVIAGQPPHRPQAEAASEAPASAAAESGKRAGAIPESGLQPASV